MSGARAERKGHAVLDLPSRDLKAAKIARLLGFRPGGAHLRLLEIGCGSGGISRYFGTEGPMGWDVVAVDVEDVRQAHGGYAFRLVAGTALPFQDAEFDVVLSNHVIEHVGDPAAQLAHLHELRRVLKRDGVAYLAVPNRWMLVEPHYRLALLSWLPQRLADAYVRLARRGTHYDCRPLAAPALERMLRAAGFSFRQRHGEALRLTYELERPRALAYTVLFKRVPDAMYAALRRAFPTLIYTLRAADGESARDVPCR
jgi:phosphatidyl-myo-inositol dimannoside synthase